MNPKSKLGLIATMIILMSLVIGCSQTTPVQKRTSVGKMDNARFHVDHGDQALKQRKYNVALTSYQKALELNVNNSSALSGQAIAEAYLSLMPKGKYEQSVYSFERSLELIEESIDQAVTEKDEYRALVMRIRIYSMFQKPDDWLDLANDDFEDAVDLLPQKSEPYFYMARAEALAGRHEKAMQLYTKVIELNDDFTYESEYEIKTLQDMQRIINFSRFSKNIAFEDSITKADLAALFMAELNLDKIYQNGRNLSNAEYRVPENQQRLKPEHKNFADMIVDIEGHPLEQVIKEVLNYRVSGLEPDPSYRFHPDKSITRAEFALLIQGILVRILNDSSLETRFLSDPSPFPDIRNDMYYYNAARLMVNRGIMTVKDKATGAFKPMDEIKGVESLLALKDIKELMQRYQY